MFITFAPWRIISLTSLPEPSCSLGKTWTCTLLLVRWATFFAKYSAARCAGSVVDSECARRILITSWAAAGAASAATSDRTSKGSFMVSPGRLGGGGGDVGRDAQVAFWNTSASLPGWAAPA